MKFLVVGKDWGVRGNIEYDIIHADSIDEVKKIVLEGMYSSIVEDNKFYVESLTVYSIDEEFNFNLEALRAQHVKEVQALKEKQEREVDERELKRLKEKLGLK